MKRIWSLAVVAAGWVASSHAGVLLPLLPRDLDGNTNNGAEAYYDPAQNITWMTDWRQGTDGGMNWPNALAWAAGLTLGGFDDWRLPQVKSDAGNCQAWNCVNTELGYLWYVVLRNTALTLSNRGHFQNMSSGPYWTAAAVDSDEAWAFQTSNGLQFEALVSNRYAVVAVRDGDTLASAIPEPSTAVLTIAGLLAAVGASRRRSPPSRVLV